MPYFRDTWYCNKCFETFDAKEDLGEHYRLNEDHIDAILSITSPLNDIIISPTKKVHYVDWGKGETLCGLRIDENWVEGLAIEATCEKCLKKRG